MTIGQLVLTKEELPILHDICFGIPIHPKLLDSKININPLIAKEIFPKVAEDWCNELKKNRFPAGWEDFIKTDENGFVSGFQISRDFGGGLYFDKADNHCYGIVPSRMIKFTPEKAREFEIEYGGGGISSVYVYASTNINDYPGALFLRNWAIMYMNEVFKEIKI